MNLAFVCASWPGSRDQITGTFPKNSQFRFIKITLKIMSSKMKTMKNFLNFYYIQSLFQVAYKHHLI